jgi:hypothetical protein
VLHFPTTPGLDPSIAAPSAPIALEADGCWQCEEPSEDVVLTGVRFRAPSPAQREQLWNYVLGTGMQLARFLVERCDLHELGTEDALGIAQSTRHRKVRAGRAIYRQGSREPSEDALFVLVRGEVQLQLRVRNAIERPLCRLRIGDLFGGLTLLSDGPHAETALAATDCELLEIDRASFRYLRTTRPWLGQRLGNALLRVSAARLQTLLAEASQHL